MKLDVRALPDEVGVARHAVASFLHDQGVPSTIVDDFELVVSELVTNAVMHGHGGPVRLEASASDEIVLAVASKSAPGSIPPVAYWTLPEPYASSGRGLAIVHRLCDDVQIRNDGRGAVVVCRRRLPDGGAVP